MQALILLIHVLVAISIVVLVLLQHGKGADVGATFGSGGSQTMFGSAGSMSFFMKLTGVLAAIFFATSLTLSYLASHQQRVSSRLQSVTPAGGTGLGQPPSAPAPVNPSAPTQ